MECKYLIIGNSAGGIAAAEAIREVDKEGKLIIISDENFRAYSRALIPYYIAKEIELDKIYYRDKDFYENNSIKLHIAKAEKIDIEQKEVEMGGGKRIIYEKLLLSTGSIPSIPPIDDLSFSSAGKFNRDGIFIFSSLNDAIEIKRRIDSGLVDKVIVLGGGRIGFMAAEALMKNGLDVTVIKRSEGILPEVFDETASSIVKEHLKDNCLQMLIGRTVKAVRGKGHIEGIVLDDETELDCDLLIIATGVRPRLELVRGTYVKVTKGIVVDRRMRTSAPDIFACGDCAEVYDALHGDFRVAPLWSGAYSGGRIAGFNMCGLVREYLRGTNINSMHFFGLPIVAAGLSAEEEGYEVLKEVQKNKKLYRKLVLHDDRIIGINFVNDIDKAGLFLGLMRAGADVSSFKKDLLSPDFGLISLPEEMRGG